MHLWRLQNHHQSTERPRQTPTPSHALRICLHHLLAGQGSQLDLSHAYLQLKLDEESRKYCTITTHKGLFHYNQLPFGVVPAPSIFQRVMESLMQGIPGVCVYTDDILVTGRSKAEHLDHLAEVLRRLTDAGMRLKKEKCHFLLPQVEYLGHIVSDEGLHTSKAKVKAMVNAPTPCNVAEFRSFLGLVNYYGLIWPPRCHLCTHSSRKRRSGRGERARTRRSKQ